MSRPWLFRQSVLAVLEGVETDHHVMKPGYRGQRGRDPEHGIFDQGIRRVLRINQRQQYSRQLGESGHLADHAGMNMYLDVHDGQNGDSHDDDDIPTDDDDGQPSWDVLLKSQRDKRCNQQEFVGNRIEVGAQFRSLIETPGDESVETVTDSCDGEYQNGEREHLSLHENDKERRQKYADDRNKVGKIDRQSGIFH